MAVIDCRFANLQRLSDYYTHSDAFELLAAVGSVEEFYNKVGREELDIVLCCGLTPAHASVQALLGEIQSRSTATKVVVMADYDDKSAMFQAMCFGATAFLPERLPLAIMEQRLLFHLQDNYWLNPAVARSIQQYFTKRQKVDCDMHNPLSQSELLLLDMVGQGASAQRVAEKQRAKKEFVKALVGRIIGKLHSAHRREPQLAFDLS